MFLVEISLLISASTLEGYTPVFIMYLVQISLLISCLFIQQILNTYSIPDDVPGNGDKMVNQTDIPVCCHGACTLLEEAFIKQLIILVTKYSKD